MAAAGVDASNVAPGHVVLLPVDPDASARALRRRLAELTGRTVGVVVTDTAGRAWREGQTDIAVGAAGLRVVERLRRPGRRPRQPARRHRSRRGRRDRGRGRARPGQARRPAVRRRARPGRPGAAGRRRRPRRRGAGAARRCRHVRLRQPRGRARGRSQADPRRRARLRAPGRRRRGGRRHRGGPADASRRSVAEDLVVVEAGDERTAWAVGVAAYAHGWEVSATASGRRRRSPAFATPYVDSAVVPRPHP